MLGHSAPLRATRHAGVCSGLGVLALLACLGSASAQPVASPLPTDPATSSPADLAEQVAQLSTAGRHREALALVDAEHARQPRPALILMMARLHQRLGQPAEARRAYQRFLAEATQAGEAQRQEALTALRSLETQAAPDRAQALLEYAEQLVAQGWPKEALETLAESYQLDPRPSVLISMARLQLRSGETAAAAESYRKYLATATSPADELLREALDVAYPIQIKVSPSRYGRKSSSTGFAMSVLGGFAYSYMGESHWLGGFGELRPGVSFFDRRLELTFGVRVHAGETLPGLTFVQPSIVIGLSGDIMRYLQIGLDFNIVSPFLVKRITNGQYLFWMTTEILPHIRIFLYRDSQGHGLALSLRPGLSITRSYHTEAGFRLYTGLSYVY